MTLDYTLSLTEFRRGLADAPRQKLPTYYRINGALYIRKINYNGGINILDTNEYAFIMDRGRSVDIDNIDDFNYAEFLMGDNNNV